MEYFCLRDPESQKLLSVGSDEEVHVTDALTSDHQLWYIEEQYIVNKALRYVLTLRQDGVVCVQPKKPKDEVWKGRDKGQFWEAQVHGVYLTVRFKIVSGYSGVLAVNKGRVCVSSSLSSKLERIVIHDIVMQSLMFEHKQQQSVAHALQQQNAQLQRDYNTIEEEHIILQRQLENLQQQHETLLEQRTSLQQKNTALRQQVAAIQKQEEQYAALRTQNEQLQQQLQERQQVVASEQSSAGEQTSSWEQRHNALHTDFGNLKQQYAKMRALLMHSNSKLEQETLQNTVLQQKFDEAQQHRRALEIKLEAYQQQHGELPHRNPLSSSTSLLPPPVSEALPDNDMELICSQAGINNLRKAVKLLTPAQVEVLSAYFSITELESSLMTTLLQTAQQFFSNHSTLLIGSIEKVLQIHTSKAQQLQQDKSKIVQILTQSKTPSHVQEEMVSVMMKEIDINQGLISEWCKVLEEIKSITANIGSNK